MTAQKCTHERVAYYQIVCLDCEKPLMIGHAPLTDAEIERGQEIAARFGLLKDDAVNITDTPKDQPTIIHTEHPEKYAQTMMAGCTTVPLSGDKDLQILRLREQRLRDIYDGPCRHANANDPTSQTPEETAFWQRAEDDNKQ